MILKTARIVYAQITLIPRSSLDAEIEEIPERGLHWGTHESTFTVTSIKRWNPKSNRAERPFRKAKRTEEK